MVAELLDEWEYPELQEVGAIERLAGGAINENYVVSSAAGARFVLRIVKEAPSNRLCLDRARAVQAHSAAAAAGLAPEVVASRLPDGHYLSRFVEGAETVTEQLLERSGMLEAVGRALARLHSCHPIEGEFSAFADTRTYMELASAEGLGLPADIDVILLKLDQVERLFERLGCDAVLAHNDLVIQNLLLASGRLWFIDFDYAGMGNRYFDLGELTSKGSLGEEARQHLVRGYFGTYDRVHDARVRLMAFMSGLREAMWSVVAAPVLDQEWDYAAWAEENFRRCRQASTSTLFYHLLSVAGRSLRPSD
ncbi:MAG: phosphotransferase [Acidimicrobiales bacterium]